MCQEIVYILNGQTVTLMSDTRTSCIIVQNVVLFTCVYALYVKVVSLYV